MRVGEVPETVAGRLEGGRLCCRTRAGYHKKTAALPQAFYVRRRGMTRSEQALRRYEQRTGHGSLDILGTQH